MSVRKLSSSEAKFERSPDQVGDIFIADMIGKDNGSPVTIGFGRYSPDQELSETMAVDDIMIILEGKLTVTSRDETHTAGPGDVVHMPKGEPVMIRSYGDGALTAYVTYPHWKDARS
jgi:ethanolamine utilization protein EutQ (cupin superfamily)